MNGLNLAILAGMAIATMRLATTRSFRKNDAWEEETEWHRVVVFGKQAENAVKHLGKGSPLSLKGRIQTRSWDDQSGQKRYATEIVAEELFYNVGAGSSQGTSQSPQAPPPSQDDLPF